MKILGVILSFTKHGDFNFDEHVITKIEICNKVYRDVCHLRFKIECLKYDRHHFCERISINEYWFLYYLQGQR